MINVCISGFGYLELEHLVLDFNGTLALDGVLLPGVAGALRSLSGQLTVHVVTADTHGGCARALTGLPVQLTVLDPGDNVGLKAGIAAQGEAEAKQKLLLSLGPERCAAVGNGRNDVLMLRDAALGVAVVQGECASTAAVQAADLIAPDILSCLGLFLHPARIKAGLRI